MIIDIKEIKRVWIIRDAIVSYQEKLIELREWLEADKKTLAQIISPFEEGDVIQDSISKNTYRVTRIACEVFGQNTNKVQLSFYGNKLLKTGQFSHHQTYIADNRKLEKIVGK